ncbi:WAP four-disulfide core domain protein 3 isoform X1 [Meleagris gallopavo]|uniref:WAP four-disulfide core domain protein 3 isoform X1 n=1 Tax=Meleagris gallopavo TaxID=9103 RepID=UPI000549A86F|nr:WAP four-disulfide core domain protein 3 isoform X1 [Meleagris gallopavo]
MLGAALTPHPATGELQKPGLCPRDFTRCLHQEPPLCTNDSACPGWLKCCSHECRLRCIPPAEEKPGACPAAAPEGLFYPCSFRCQEDKDCLGSQKCCPLGCGPACVEPAQDICHLPAVPGPCGGHELSFFYNVTSGRCETFPYGGCGGNANRFGTRAACRRACLGHEKPKTGECPVELPELDGPCREECDGDSDCPNALKCCNSSCGLQCLPAAPARKDGFCPASTGLFPSYDCREWCRRDADCPGEEKCCLQGCDYVCLRPAQEKPGICPLSEQAAGSQCQDPCAGDGQCPGDEKCCSSRCGHVCMAPEPDKPGQCPKVRPQLTSEPCTEEDDCLHDRDCPRQEKCCFSGCAMRCSRPAREHPGQCPRAEPCWDPRRRRRNQCLDDSVCRRDEKCCNTGCTWGCVAVPRESSGGASRQCAEECETDAQCLQGQRCTHMGCSHVCVDIPGGRVGVCPISRDASTCMDLCSLDEECPWGQKCCSNGCSHVCMPASLEEPDAAVVPQHGARRCPEQCDADSQCPRGQRCTRTSCGHVCMDMPRGTA